jgi:plastocyanin
LGPTGVRLWYSPAKITVAQSDAMFELVNPSGGGHNLLISNEVGGEVLAGQSVGVNQTAILDATDVPPGTYKMWCSIPEHVGYGMVGTLTITQ